MQIRCSNPACGEKFDRAFSGYACTRCGDLLEIAITCTPDGEALKAEWKQRRMSNEPADTSGVWRFRDLLPEYDADDIITMGEGNSTLVAAIRTAEYAGVKNLHFKHLGWNPTACFKDIGMTVAVSEARHRGAKIVACASTGNTSGSMAAYAARAGLTARVYLPKGKVSSAKIAQSIDYGAEIVEVDGNFDQALDGLIEHPDPNIYFLNSINPFRIEGQKTVMFELMDQLDWNPPDYVIVPGGNLGNSSAFGKGLEELHALGMISKIPRLIIVQATGANALVRTFLAGGKHLEKVENPHTRATAISIGSPKSWKKALRALQFTNGLVLDVSDEEIAKAKVLIGRDGIGCEPASATTLAGLRRLVASGEVDPKASFVAILTGHVLKDPDAILEYQAQEVHQELAYGAK